MRKTPHKKKMLTISSYSAQTRILLNQLNSTLNILIFDDNKNTAELLALLLERYPVFNLTQVHSRNEVNELYEKEKWHCWVVDLYAPDIKDGMHIIKAFAKQVPIIGVSGKATAAEGYKCSRLHVVDFIDKGELNSTSLVERVFTHAMKKMIFPEYPNLDSKKISLDAVETLFEKSPQSVGEWARYTNVTPRTMENWCQEATGKSPRDILSLYLVFHLAFNVYRSQEFETMPISSKEATLVDMLSVDKERFEYLIGAPVNA